MNKDFNMENFDDEMKKIISDLKLHLDRIKKLTEMEIKAFQHINQPSRIYEGKYVSLFVPLN